ncbi:hypothetical protein [Companilactobacillus farciminis]|uniref:hypothetical protein n=1 Tax=Companilactobacillus farciminis TaxID=1612 RepID=UPI00232BC56F|nr:hypothetical protein [Companilactobacillus farciminis]WCG35923.1 hypothetical protein PML84_01715 [Companilactobacillus farciminis]
MRDRFVTTLLGMLAVGTGVTLLNNSTIVKADNAPIVVKDETDATKSSDQTTKKDDTTAETKEPVYKTVDIPTVNSDKTISGKISVYSHNYQKYFDYTYKGNAGETVTAVTDADKTEYPNVPTVTVKIAETIDTKLVQTDTVDIVSKLAQAYDDAGRPLITNEIKITTDGTVYYHIGVNEWLKASSNVTLESTSEADTITGINVDVNDPITANVTIPSNMGDQEVDNQTGGIGKKISVPVPNIKGYTPDKTSVQATVNEDGTITTDEKVTYTKAKPPVKVSSGSSSPVEIGKGYLEQTIAVHPNEKMAQLYSFTGKGFAPEKNVALAGNTDWFSDQMITIGNSRFYRVATDEWVKDSDIYVYETNSRVYTTKKQTNLVNSKEQAISNRALAKDTDWDVDRVAYLGSFQNPVKAYRVATNEFVLDK